MTSKNLFIKMLLQSVKDKIWGVALSVVGLLFSFPIYAVISISMLKQSAAIDPIRAGILPRLFRMQVLGEGNIPVILCTIGIALYMAVNGFDYLFSREKVDLYHALSIKREKLFLVNYVAGVLIYVVPYTIFMLTTLVIGNINGMLDNRGVVVSMQMLLVNMIAYLLIYTSGVAVVMLVGTRAVAVLLIAVTNIYFPMLEGILDMFKEDYFDTYYSSYFLGNHWLSRISPIGEYTNLCGQIDSFKNVSDFSSKSVVLAMIAVILFFVVAMWIYKKRPSEAATKALAFKKSEKFLSIFILILGALAGGSFLVAIIGFNAKDQTSWLIFGMVAAAIIGHCVLQAIFYQDFKALGKKLTNPIIALAIAGFVASIFMLDLTNFDGYIPKETEFESAAISSYNLQSGIEYYDFNQEINEWGYSEYLLDQTEYRLNNMKLTDYETIKAIALKGIEQTKELSQLDGENIEAQNTVDLVVRYNLKNGKEKYRSYTIRTQDILEEYGKLFDTKEYKETVYPILADENIEYENLEYFDGVNMQNLAALSKEQRKQIADACIQETYTLKASEIEDEIPIGYIYVNHTTVENGMFNYYNVDKTFIYPSFEKTIVLLKEFGVDVDTFKDASKVDAITVSSYTDEGEKTVKYSDTEQISAILDKAAVYEMFSNDSAFHDTANVDGNINRVGRDDNNEMIFFSFEKGKIPEFVLSDLEKASFNNGGEAVFESERMY